MQKKSWQKSRSFHGKSSEETSNRKNVTQQNKGYIWQTYRQHYTKERKTETIFSRVRNETKVSTLPTLFKIALEFLARAIGQKKKIKGTQ
jgi:hypothetical protein